MKLEKEYKRVAALLRARFRKELIRREPEVIEVVMILVFGLLLGWGVVNEVAQRLGINKDQLYNRLKELSLKDWRRLFSSTLEQMAIECLLEAQEKSDATWSRLGVVLGGDDSVVRKWGKFLSYLSKWWSGQFHRILKGHDVIMIVLKVGDKVIPVGFWTMSKRGALSNRHKRMGRLLEEIAKRWKEAGIHLERIPVTIVSAYQDSDLIETIKEAGFKKVLIGAKASNRLFPGRSKKHSVNLAEAIKKEDFSSEPSWAMSEKVAMVKGTSPTFGKVTVLARYMLGKIRRVFAVGIHRRCEILRIWKAHHWIEEVFKRLKYLLSWGSYSLQGKEGAYASIVIGLLAYFVLLNLQKSTGKTFAKLCRAIDQGLSGYTKSSGKLVC